MGELLSEEETLEKIKFVLSCNNDAQAIRLLEQYVQWRQEKSYSETNIKEAFLQGLYHTKGEDTVDEWFETFKKK
jgi:hypothetical protein